MSAPVLPIGDELASEQQLRFNRQRAPHSDLVRTHRWIRGVRQSALARLRGITNAQATGWGWTDALHPDDRARLIEYWRTSITSGVSGEFGGATAPL